VLEAVKRFHNALAIMRNSNPGTREGRARGPRAADK
jgi:hypothetical protein